MRVSSELYSCICESAHDVTRIANNLNMPEMQIQRIKDHIFLYNTHQIDYGIARFYANLDIANAWKRLEIVAI